MTAKLSDGFLNVCRTIRMTENTNKMIAELNKKFPDKYDNESHVVRVAVIALYQKEFSTARPSCKQDSLDLWRSKMNIKVEPSKKIADGMHKGIIVSIGYRTEPYEYTDIEIETYDKIVVTVSYPTFICPTSKLGRLLQRFGKILEIGTVIDPGTVLVGRHVFFQSTSEEKNGVKYSKVLTESLLPQ